MVNAHSSYCHICGRRLVGRYFQYDSGLIVCTLCDDQSVRCARCNVPLTARDTAGVAPGAARLCRACQGKVAHCSSCNEPIIHEWYTFGEIVPAAERRFCPRCAQGRPRCDLCHAPTGAQPILLNHGQYRCALCAADMVLQEPAIRATYVDAVVAFQRATKSNLRAIPPLHVVGRVEMNEARRRFTYERDFERDARRGQLMPPPLSPAAQPTHATPLTPFIRQTGPSAFTGAAAPAGAQAGDADGESQGRHTLGFFVRTQGETAIYIEMGLTRGLLLGTLAHELSHAWQAEQLGPGHHHLDPMIEEGFAEWVAYHALLTRGLTTLTDRATKRDDLYGRGLRHFLTIERTHGLAGVLSAALGRAP